MCQTRSISTISGPIACNVLNFELVSRQAPYSLSIAQSGTLTHVRKHRNNIQALYSRNVIQKVGLTKHVQKLFTGRSCPFFSFFHFFLQGTSMDHH